MLTCVVLGSDPHCDRVAALLGEHLNGTCEITRFATVRELLSAAESLNDIALIIALIEPEGSSADETFQPIVAHPAMEQSRIILISTTREVVGLAALTDAGKLDMLWYASEINNGPFLDAIDSQISRYRRRCEEPDGNEDAKLMFDVRGTDHEVIDEFMDIVDRTLGYQPRVLIPPGVRLTIETQQVEEVIIALRGRVALERESHAGNVLMHHASTGPIIGLLALTHQRPAFFTSRTTTEVLGVHLTFEHMAAVIRREPRAAQLLAVLTIRSLDRRLRRSEDIQIEKVELAQELERERANLATALSNLEAARAELIAQARFASLGALSAGVAHEVNNPMAAIARICQHLDDDITRLVESSGERRWAGEVLTALNQARTAPPLSTREERFLRRDFQQIVGDAPLARQLVLAGVRDPAAVKKAQRRMGVGVTALESAASIGSELRNLETAASRITELVASLRAYSRPDGAPLSDVDIHVNLVDSLRLIEHRLDGVKVVRNFGDLPKVTCHPGQLSQVWTNLVVNAAEALTDQAMKKADGGTLPARIGTITITTDVPEDGWIRVRIQDDGPGIPDDLAEHIFEPRFTTKQGQVRFGLGIGLGVCKSVVLKHGGRIRMSSNGTGAVATVRLPVGGPPPARPGLDDHHDDIHREILNGDPS